MAEAVEITQPESRVKKTLLNARVNLIFYFLTLALSFVSRKVFLNCLGTEFIGLTGTLLNLLGSLNLAELGIGSAIGYVLYKPIFENDRFKINEIISVMGWLYRWIGIVILVGGLILSCFLPIIFPVEGRGTLSLMLIYCVYFSFLTTSLIGYFINYRQNLLGADQKNYVVTAYYQTANIVKIVIQMASAWYTQSYYLWVAIDLSFGIIYSFILNDRINKTYPWLKTEVSQGREVLKKYPEVIKYTKQLFIQKISYYVQYQTTPLLIYSFVNLTVVALYDNYIMITSKLANFISNFLDSTGASIGNLIAEGNQQKIKGVFWELMAPRFLIAGIMSFGVFTLMNPFITIWLGVKFLLPTIVLLLITINVFISYIRGAVMQFLFGYGLFRDVWAPVAEICINLGVAVVGGALWGLPGILLGGLVSQILIVGIWKPYFLYREGFKESVWLYWSNISVYYLCVLAPWVAMTFLILPCISINPAEGYITWIIYSIIVMALYSILTFAMLMLTTRGMRAFTNRFIARLRK